MEPRSLFPPPAIIRAYILSQGEGNGSDYWRRLELALLPDEALEALTDLFTRVEIEGAFPDSL